MQNGASRHGERENLINNVFIPTFHCPPMLIFLYECKNRNDELLHHNIIHANVYNALLMHASKLCVNNSSFETDENVVNMSKKKNSFRTNMETSCELATPSCNLSHQKPRQKVVQLNTCIFIKNS